MKNSQLTYPNPSFQQIEVDLNRTFPHIQDDAQLEALTTPLKNVLTAFVLRNPTVGYCQGVNFIAARLLTCMNEEEAFWTLNQIIEKYLPLDYYSNMVGVLVDQKVLQIYMQRRLPKLCEHLRANDFSLDLVAFQWIVCLFASNLPQPIGFAVWDLFFIKGIVVLFRVALTILSLMQDEILQTDKFEDIYFIIENYCGTKLDIRSMMEKFADPISIKEVERLRKEQRLLIMAMLKR